MIKVERIEYNIVLDDFPNLKVSLFYSEESIEEVKTFLTSCYGCKLKEGFDYKNKSINFEYFEDIEVIQEMIEHISNRDFRYLLDFESENNSTQVITKHLNHSFDLSFAKLEVKNEE